MAALNAALLVVAVAACLVATCSGYIEHPGPRFVPTQGEVWPKPQTQTYYDGERLSFSLENFEFQVVGDNTCPALNAAVIRYNQLIAQQWPALRKSRRPVGARRFWGSQRAQARLVSLTVLNINLTSPCENWPSLGMNEQYSLDVGSPNDSPGTSQLVSDSLWGILRGLETFSQLMYSSSTTSRDLVINATSINDFPRFTHRGLLLDTSRHFISLKTIRTLLDGMVYNKLNVFHWHIVDDQSFPYQSTKFPSLSEKGAYHPRLVYSQENVKDIIEYARVRGIRVMTEFDTPGHTRSWGVAFPELLTECYTAGVPNGDLGPINPTTDAVYTFMEDLLTEVTEVFPDDYLHLGGDEVEFDCWQSNPSVTKYMADNNIVSYKALEEVYIQKIVDMVAKLNSSSVVWQEVYLNGVRLPKGTVVQIWTGDQEALLQNVTGSGLPALLSSCWYLDHLANGGDWSKYYSCDPHDFSGTPEQKQLVLGGEACMWGEVIDDTNVISRIFPRASAVAEKLWSAHSVTDQVEARHRIEEHTCRLVARGINAQPPSGPGFCVALYE